MKFLKVLKERTAVACVLFTVLTFSFTAFMSMMGVADAQLFADRLAILLLFSAMISVSNLVLNVKKLNKVIAVAIHFVLCYGSMFLCVFGIFYNTSGMKDHKDYSAGEVFVATLAFITVYVIAIAVKLISDSKKQKRSKTEVYTKQFKSLS